MENASKALIIALGIYVFNMAKGASNTKALDELEISQFNQPFKQYEGKTMGAGVIDLLDKLVSNAAAYYDSDERLPDVIYIDGRSSGAKTSESVDGSVELSNDEKDKTSASDFDAEHAQFIVRSDSSAANGEVIGRIRKIIAEKHYYQVGFANNDTTGIIEYVFIEY